MAPSPKALQSLIDVCVVFAREHDLVFNTKKSKLICIEPGNMKKVYIPDFVLGQSKIRFVQRETDLGYGLVQIRSKILVPTTSHLIRFT